MLKGFDGRTGELNRCYTRDSAYHLAPRGPQREQGLPVSTPRLPSGNRAPRSPSSPKSMDNSASVRMEGSRTPKDGSRSCGKSFSKTLGAGCQLICMKEDSAVVLDARATAKFARFRRLSNRTPLLGRMGLPPAVIYPARARFKFGDIGMGRVHFAAEITVVVAEAKGNLTDFVSDTDIPAFLRNGVVGSPWRAAGFFS